MRLDGRCGEGCDVRAADLRVGDVMWWGEREARVLAVDPGEIVIVRMDDHYYPANGELAQRCEHTLHLDPEWDVETIQDGKL